MQRISGIYKIQSMCKPDRCYIGSSVNIGKRWNHHISNLRKGVHHSPKLQNHYNKYGEADLQLLIILGCDKEFLLETEQYFLDSYKPYFNIYQTTRQYSTEAQSESSNQKRSKSMMGKRHTEEAKKRMSESMKGMPKSEEHKRKLSECLKGPTGTQCSEERKKKLSEDRIGVNNPMYGKKSWNSGIKMDESFCEKCSAAHKGSVPWNKGIKGVSVETSQKMSASQKGKKRKRTKEHQLKLSESRKRNNLLKKAIINGSN